MLRMLLCLGPYIVETQSRWIHKSRTYATCVQSLSIKYDDLMSNVQGLSQNFQEMALNIYEGVSLADKFNCKRFLLSLFNNRIKYNIFCSGHSCADETLITQECSGTDSSVTAMPSIQGFTKADMLLSMLERDDNFSVVDMSCSWLVLRSQQP